jgi:DNA-nicking Smr family endonuclease
MAKDLDLFRAAMADVAPLKERRKGRRPGRRVVAASVALSPAAPPPRPPQRASPRLPQPTPTPTPVPVAPLSFDRDIERALSRGRRSPEAKLDLHGMTLAAAERAVTRFLEEAVSLDMRVVLIVTGKGLRQEEGRIVGGRIRAEFPTWLQRPDNRARVRGVKPAHQRHGGGGAFYVLLRRRQRR